MTSTFQEPDNKITIEEIIRKSTEFSNSIKFPINSIKCETLKSNIPKEVLERNINSAYPLIHEDALRLCSLFLSWQKTSGRNKEFYKDISVLQLIDRLLSKRAVTFLNPSDQYALLSGKTGSGSWETIGTEDEKPPLTLADCLSYDEIKLSALLSVSSHTVFLNDGDRNNAGKFEKSRNSIEEEGVIVGMIGPRLEKSRVMEYREIVKSKEQNTGHGGYGDEGSLQTVFLKFYGDVSETFDQLRGKLGQKERFIDLGRGKFFDRLMYERRIAISIDTLLIEANARAGEEGTKAYVHVVGLGLGVWKICQQQNKIFVDTFAQRIELLSDILTHISDVRFAYIHEEKAGKFADGDKIKHIKLHMNNKNPQERLTGDDSGKLLVVSYPWDGNALPGNEFWGGSLCGSGDPAAACSTQVAELHNYHINGRVRAANLKVATSKGLVDYCDYRKSH